MLSIKWTKIHGVRDERWTTKDKLHLYRSCMKLHVRDKHHRTEVNEKLKKIVSRELTLLTTDVKQYRDTLGELVEGDKHRTRTTLQQYRPFQLAYSHQPPHVVYEAIYQDCDLRRRQLDKLYYERKKRAKQFIDLQLERNDLLSKLEEDELFQELDPEEQRLATRIHEWRIKENAARLILNGYKSMVDILKRDAAYYDALLDALQVDQVDQCKKMVSITIIGQLTAEKLDDARTVYNHISRDILFHMRIREKALAEAREQAEDIWAYAQSLVRVESDPTLTKRLTQPRTSTEGGLDEQIAFLESIFDQVKDSLLVRSYHELFPRLEEQMKQKTRLLAQFEHNLRERDSYLAQKQQALQTLAGLEHTVVANTGQYKTDKKAMLDQIEVQKKREVDCTNLRKVRGELLMRIRAALQNMITILIAVKRGGKGIRKITKEEEKRSKELMGKDDKEDGQEESESLDQGPVLEKIESDGLVLLSKVSRKVGALFGMTSFELDPDRAERARDLYQSYVADYKSQLKFGKDDSEPTGLIVDHELPDPTVPTRHDIKLRSKQLVEANIKVE